MKTYAIYAGINGSGKSTLYHLGLRTLDERRVNSDEILAEAGDDWRDDLAQAKAMKVAAEKLKELIGGDESFNQETTLTGRSILRNIKTAKTNGFRVRLYYVGLESAELAIKRVAERVQKGGHGVPDDVIRKRYDASLRMFAEVASLCDEITIFDNSGKAAEKIAEAEDGKWFLYCDDCRWLNKAMPNIIHGCKESAYPHETDDDMNNEPEEDYDGR